MPMSLNVLAFYVAANALILFALALNTSRVRRRTATDLLDGGKPEMVRAMRAHGNAAETIPIVLILMAVVQMMGASPWALHLIGVLLTVGRLLHPVGLIRGVLALRAGGMMLTLAAAVVAVGWILISFVTAP